MPVAVEIRNNRIYIEADRSWQNHCKMIPGARWDRTAQQWHCPVSWAACKQLRATFGSHLEIGPELLAWAQWEVTERITPSLALRDALKVKDSGGLHPDLYEFQKAGVQFLITAKRALLADPMGAGKTIQVIAAAQAVNALPALVICPASMKRTWGREINKWWPNVPVYIVEGSAKKRQDILATAADTPGVVTINWESVRLHSRLAPYGSISLSDKEKALKELNHIPFKLVVVDEAHRMKDPTSKQTRATWAVGHGATVEYRWALTGTPITNQPDTLYPILHFLDPNEWPNKTSYVERYCMSSLNVWGGLEIFGLKLDMREEFYSIFDPRFRRMPKEIILPQLPPIIYETRHVEMSPRQAASYNRMVEELVVEGENGELVIARNPISQLTRCTQLASTSFEVTEEGVKLCDPSSKLDQFIEDLDDINEPVVVFAQSRQLIRMAAQRLEKKKLSFSVIEGGQSPDVRQNAIDSFQRGDVDITLVVIAAGGVGITLTRARIAIFLQRSWSNVDQQQAIGRIHRIGSEIHESIVVLDYITNGTVEEGQLAVLSGKADSLEEIIRDKQAIKRLLKGEVEG